MLKLEADCGEGSRDDKAYSAPKYIALPAINNVIGRGYQAEIRLPYPWLSRKHLSITKVDGNSILDVQGQTGVFINSKRVTFTRLTDGDKITIGGGRKNDTVGCHFPSAGPYVTYVFHKSAKEMKDKENCYKDATKPGDLIQVPDVVNGQVVTQSYHVEDFNGTDELTPADSIANVTLVNESISVHVPPKNATPLKRLKLGGGEPQNPAVTSASGTENIPHESGDCPDLASNTASAQGSNTAQTTASVERLTANTPTQANPVTSPLIKQRAGRRKRAAANACNDMLNEKLGKPGKAKGKAGKKKAAANGANTENVDTTENPAEDVLPELETPEVKVEAPDIKPENSLVKIEVKSEPAPVKVENAEIKTEIESVKVESVNDTGTSLATETVKTEPIPNVDASSANEDIKMMDYDPDMACCIVGSGSPTVTKPQTITLDSDTESKPLLASLPKPSRKRKRIDYRDLDSIGNDSDYCPDSDKADDEDEDKPLNSLKGLIRPTKKARVDKPAGVGAGKGKASGKAKAKNQKKAGPTQEEIEEKAMIKKWFNEIVPRPKPRMVEVLNGMYRRSLYNFTDKQVFTVVYKQGEDMTQKNLWDTEEYEVIVSVDSALFEHKLRLGQVQADDLTRVLRLIRKSINTLNIKDYDQPTPATKLKRVPKPEAIQLELKQYQLDTLGQMYLVESQVDRTWSVSKLAEWIEAETSIMFDVQNRRVYFPPIPSLPQTEYRVSIKGGILADEMGLGKTVTLLALIAAHQGTELPRIPPPDVFRNHEELHLPTRATLVIAPSHLTAQWKHEVEQHAPSLKVIIITTKPQFERVSYADILQSDLVVVSVQFLLNNKVYTTLPTGADAETSFMELLQKPGINPLTQKSPNFNHFDWWRLVCDEAHELITYESKFIKKGGYEMQSSNGLQVLLKLKARHKWYMTGTPFPHAEKSLRGALKFLEMKIDDPTLTYPDGSLRVDQDTPTYQVDFSREGLYLTPIHRFILDTVYIRNTKQSIGLEYDVPEYVEELMLLTQSDVEKGIYDRSSNELERRQLCCHLQIAARVQMIAGIQQKSLQEVRTAMIAHTKTEIERTNRNIETTKEDIKRARTEYAAEDRANYRSMINNRITRLKDSIKSYEDMITKHNSSLAYFENIVPRITQSADEPCVICFDNIERLTLTPCGHLYCRKCILAYVQQEKQCPTCRKTVYESQLVEVQDPRQRENLQKSAELQNLTEQFGTKMAYLIFFLRHLFKNDPNSRVIVFSQWDELLHKIGSTLNDNGIRNVFVKGNVHVRNKAIMSFRKQEKTRVIMLSLQNAASGTNLVEASHVILIDPVAGSKAEAVAIESQAIGRAHRMGQDKEIRVVRMIMKDTIEHELYSRNNAESIQQVELNFDEEEMNAHGPQVIRKVRKVPKPETIQLSTTASVFTNADNGASTSGTSRTTSGRSSTSSRKKSSGGRKSWRSGGWGFGRRRKIFWMGGLDPYDNDDYHSDGDGNCNCPDCTGLYDY